MKIRFLFLLAILFAVGCTSPATPLSQAASATIHAPVSTTPVPPAATPPTGTPTIAGLNLGMLRNDTFVLRSSSERLSVNLVDGNFRVTDTARNATIFGRMIDLAAFGDLDGDGAPDAAVIIAANYGGSGTFHELIVLLSKDGKLVQAANLQLGDRIVEKTFSIQNGIITLDYLRQGPKDPMCCPSQHAQTTYQFKAGQLVVVEDQVLP